MSGELKTIPQLPRILFKIDYHEALILLCSPYRNMAKTSQRSDASLQARAIPSVPVLRSVSEPRDLVDAVHRSLLGIRGFLGHRIVERRVILRPVSLPSVARHAEKQRK